MKWICFGLIFALFAPFVAAQNASAIQKEESACGPFNVKFNVNTNAGSAPRAPAGKAEVYVVEDWAPSGASTGFQNPIIRVGMDRQWVGADQGNSYLTFAVAPGEHHLCVNWQPGHFYPAHATTALYRFEAKPDQTYFFRMRMPSLPDAFGVLHSVSFGILLDPVNVDEGQLLVAQYPHAASSIKK